MPATHPIVQQIKNINKYTYGDLASVTGIVEARIRRGLNGRIQLPADEMKKIEQSWREILARGYA